MNFDISSYIDTLINHLPPENLLKIESYVDIYINYLLSHKNLLKRKNKFYYKRI